MKNASIVILTKKAGNGFQDVLEAVYTQKYPGDFEVIVVDSGSTDNTLEIARNYPAEVHHIKPVGLYPALELDPKNLITLCGNPRCHLDKGHLGNWRSYNETVVMDTKIWSDKYRNRP